jgi:glycosyltransferase involved in cell wall biosynthesis
MAGRPPSNADDPQPTRRLRFDAGHHLPGRRPSSGTPRMRVLCIVTSSNQLYSGIGRALFELSSRLADRVRYEFAIDDRTARNVDLLVAFGQAHGFPVHVGPARSVDDHLDPLNVDLAPLLRRGRWDAIECLGWADAATHDVVLREAGDVTLAYTPHHQPLWTVPMSAAEAANVARVHARMVRRSDLVLCDSPWERRELQAMAPDRDNCTFLPLGCQFDAFRPGPWPRREQLLFVGDFAELRKRFDRVVEVFGRLLKRRPELQLVVIGNRSDQVHDHLPPAVREACVLRGYVDEEQLRRAYAVSRGLFLLSDFEAFGIPILEGLVSGTPVFLTEMAPTRSLFGRYRGAHFCPPDDLDATAAIVEGVLARGAEAIKETTADRLRLQATFDWDILAARKWEALAAAWFAHRCCPRPA